MSKTLVVKWSAKDKGKIKIPLDDLYCSIEEWNELSDEQQEEIVKDIIYSEDEIIVYGTLDSFEIIDE